MDKAFIILLLVTPFAGFIINLIGNNKFLKKSSPYIGSISAILSFVWALCLFIEVFNNESMTLHLFKWIDLGGLSLKFDFTFDRLALLWSLFVTGIGSLIHIYSISYMSDDDKKPLYFSYLNLFIFFMLVLVGGSNLLVTFIGWEGVGLCSYLLIGFWTKDHSNNDAGKKAFVMNRIGDLGFIIAIVTLIIHCGTLTYTELSNTLILNSLSTGTLVIITIGLLVGALGKSAQIPLYTWLPDAMAGPTPVSALIHAATMVTAGIYLIVKLHFLFDLVPGILLAIAIIGCFTSLLAAIIALKQTDIKKILAYSTISQLGLIFMALGVGAYHVAIFHVVTHAFFKACLFLGAGSVIHSLGGEQDIRKMGNLKQKMPITYLTFAIAACSIAGIPFTAGFFSKDEIMISLFEHYTIFWAIGIVISLFTSYYIFRALFLTFLGEFRGDENRWKHVHESNYFITIPLIILGILSIASGYIGWPGANNWINTYLSPVVSSLSDLHHVWSKETFILMLISSIIAFIGLLIAYLKFVKRKEIPLANKDYKGINKIIYNKFYIDELYNLVIFRPLWYTSYIFKILIENIIRFFINLLGYISVWSSAPLSKLQNGSVSFYLFFFILGFGAVVTFLFYIIKL